MKKIALFSSVLILGILACEESRVACLDPNAVNFDFGAVSPCDSCCEYPELTLDFILTYDTLDYDLGDYVTLDSGDSLAVDNFSFALSGFRFYDSAATFQISDQVHANDITLTDDYFILCPLRLGGEVLGTTGFETDLTGMDFNIGVLRDSVDLLKPFSTLGGNTHFATLVDSLYDSDTDIFTTVKLSYALQDTNYRQLAFPEYFSQVSLPVDNIIMQGQNWRIDLKLDLSLLFEGISSVQDSTEQKSIIEKNIPSSMQLIR